MRNTEKYKNNSVQLLKDFDLLHVPVNLTKLAQELDITIVSESLGDDVSGKIEYNSNDNNVLITISQDEIEFRQNFSLAHELGHYIYDIDFSERHVEIEDQTTFLRSNSNNSIERRANQFAARLLMPKDLFNNVTNKIKNDLFPNSSNKLGVKNIYKIVSELSEKFHVSKPAVIMRLAAIEKINRNMKSELFEYHAL
ncbi:MAG: Zn-dependent peptidase ImmA (M78 family) [Sulfurimonas sp.]|jgi:Zn-dependent peptidase ImmA (M78 family)